MKRIFMTGATSGLGKISAMQAAENGNLVIALARNLTKGKALQVDYKAQFPEGKGRIEIIEGNLTSLESVVSACEEVRQEYPSIDMLVNNAGIMNFEHKRSSDNIEETLQVNLLAPILISHLLFDKLKAGDDSKIIFTASALHQGTIHFENMEFEDSFSSFKVYRQSKLGVILFCRLLSKSLEEHGVHILSQHPGVVKTELGRDAGWFSKLIFSLMGKSPKKGAETLNYLMETAPTSLESGAYYANKKVTKTTKESYDMELADKLLKRVNTYLQSFVKADSPILKV